MGYQVITTSVLLVFFNLGVIGGLQRLMHALDMDLGNQHLYPWRTELWYALYQFAIVCVLLWMSRETSGYLRLVLVDCQLVVALTIPHALKTLPAIMVALVADFAAFAALLGTGTWQFGLGVAVYLLWLVVQEQVFAPFDQFMTIRILFSLVAGGGFWLLLQPVWRLSTASLAAMMISFLIAMCATFTYMVLLRREHIVDRTNARNVAYDGLTDAYNWLSFRKAITQAFAQSPSDLSLLAIDLDDFKTVNTRFGHPVGNQVLIAFVDSLKAVLEVVAPDSTLARTGGEEFMVILPHTSQAQALAVARACQDRARELAVPLEDGNVIRITTSIGVAAADEADDGVRDLYRRADNFLRRAKLAGRDRVISVDE